MDKLTKFILAFAVVFLVVLIVIGTRYRPLTPETKETKKISPPQASDVLPRPAPAPTYSPEREDYPPEDIPEDIDDYPEEIEDYPEDREDYPEEEFSLPPDFEEGLPDEMYPPEEYPPDYIPEEPSPPEEFLED